MRNMPYWGPRRTEATGLGTAIMFAGGMAVPPAFGLCVTALGGYRTSYMIGAAAALAGGLLLALPQQRWRLPRLAGRVELLDQLRMGSISAVSTSSASCSRFVALAMGAVATGRAIRPRQAICPGFASYRCAASSSAVSAPEAVVVQVFFHARPRRRPRLRMKWQRRKPLTTTGPVCLRSGTRSLNASAAC